VANIVKGVVVATFASSAIVQLIISGSLNSIFGATRYMQLLVHMMLINIMLPANASIFFGSLLKIAGFDLVPTDAMFVYLFDIEETPISTNFDYLGYETRQVLYNAGSLSLIIMFFLPFLLIICLIGLLPCKSA